MKEEVHALKCLKVPQMPAQEVLGPSLQLGHKTSSLLWGHLPVVRKRQRFDGLSAFFAESEIEEVHFSLWAFFTFY